MNKRMLLVSFAFAVICVFPIVNQAQSIGQLDNRNGLLSDGCGWPQIWPKGQASYGGKGFFYVLPDNGGDTIMMKLDGKIVNLGKAGGSRGENLRKGSSFTEVYRGQGYVVRVTYVVTKVVRDPDEGNVYDYAATITATKGKTSKSVRGIAFGGC